MKGVFFMDFINYIQIALALAMIVLAVRLYSKAFGRQDYSPVRLMARVAIFGAMSIILYTVPVFKFSLPIFPSFLEIHFDEVPAFIAGFAYGPLCGFLVIALKTVAKLPMSSTLMVGEVTDFILSSVYVCTASFIYKRIRNLKGVAIGFGVATLLQVIIAMFINVYLMIPFYANVMGFPIPALLSLMQKAIPSITDTGWSYAFLAVLPFNLLKDALVIVITFIIYRSLHLFLRFEGGRKKKRG